MSFENPRKNKSAATPSAQIQLRSYQIKFHHNTTKYITCQKLPTSGKEYDYFKTDRITSQSS